MRKALSLTAIAGIVIGVALLSAILWSHHANLHAINAAASSPAIDPTPVTTVLEVEPPAQETSPAPVLASIAPPPQEGQATVLPIAGALEAEPPVLAPIAPPPPKEQATVLQLVTLVNDRISIQTATKEACCQAGYNYQWQRSYDATQPDCRRYVQVNLSDAMIEGALDSIVTSNGLAYRIDGKEVWLERPQ